MTTIEMVFSAFVLAFLVAATSTLYDVGFRQQRLSRRYSQAQTDLRASLAQMTRTIRHAYKVIASSSNGTLAGQSSSATQVIVQIPQPGGAAAIEVLFAIDGNGNLYYQRSTDQAGTAITYGAQTVDIHYFQTSPATSGSVTNNVDNAPGSATDVQITLTLNRDRASTSVTSYTTLRNKIVGL